MREYLVGYLLEALEPAEHEMVEAQLARDPELKRELDLISRSLQPLAADSGHFDPPAGLAHRTCEFVAHQAKVMSAPANEDSGARSWSFADMVVAAGIFLAATALFVPAVTQSRFAARVTGCQNNLRQIGLALRSYSTMYHGMFPVASADGRCAITPALLEHGLLDGTHLAVCPGSDLADQVSQYRYPTLDELRQIQQESLVHFQKEFNGSYGYTLGHISNGRYEPTRDRGRVSFALVADVPSAKAPFHSLNHGGCGQNVLFEDGHVQYLTTCKAHGCSDEIFTNDQGEVAPGLHAGDAVIGPHTFRVLVPVTLKIVPVPER